MWRRCCRFWLSLARWQGAGAAGSSCTYGGDNQVVRGWIKGRKSGTVVGRLLVRILNMLEMRFRCVVIPAWWRTYHNTHADYIARCSDTEFEQLVADKLWIVVSVTDDLRQAMIRNSSVLPSWPGWEESDRQELLQLKEQRLKRQVPRWNSPVWEHLRVVELAGQERFVFDFAAAAGALGCQVRTSKWAGPIQQGEIVLAAFPPDFHGKVASQAAQAAINGDAAVVVFEGPRAVNVGWHSQAVSEGHVVGAHWRVRHLGVWRGGSAEEGLFGGESQGV